MNRIVRTLFMGGILVAMHAVNSAATEGDASQVVASQGGVQVTLADIDSAMLKVPEERRAHFIDSPRRIETLISGLLLQKQLAAQGRAAGLDSDPKIAAATGLEQVGLLALAQSSRFKDSITVPDVRELAKERYQANREKYVVPAMLEVQDILITTGVRSDAEAQTLAETVAAEAVKDPSSFDGLVQKYSGDPDKAKSKGLVKNPAGPRYDAGYIAAANALVKPDDISPIVKTGDGLHVLKLVRKSPSRQQSFDEVREQMLVALSEEFKRKAIQNYVDGLRNQPMQANADLIASLRTRYNGATDAPATAPGSGAAKTQ